MSTTNSEPSIYIVDDEALLGEMAEAVLEIEGLRARVFTNPAEALNCFLAAEPRPTLLLTDCVMKEMSGIELIQRCRQDSPGLRTVLLSGTVALEYVARLGIRPDRFISKPYRVETLLGAVRELLSGQDKAEAKP